MQYTATSYAEPLVRVFDDALAAESGRRVTHVDESRYLVGRWSSASRSPMWSVRACTPGPSVRMDRLGESAPRVQNGSIHRYLMFSFVALVVVLLVVAL